MDWAFTKPSTLRPRFLPHHAYATVRTIQLSNNKQNSFIMPEVAPNPLLLQNCN